MIFITISKLIAVINTSVLTKAEIIQKGLGLGVDYSETTSCYDANTLGEACGECDACVLRKIGFENANVQDPTRYQ